MMVIVYCFYEIINYHAMLAQVKPVSFLALFLGIVGMIFLTMVGATVETDEQDLPYNIIACYGYIIF